MRTKTLLLTAALSAAGVAASMAQVYSVNVVGYVNQTVQPGKWAILANPLNNGANAINSVLPLPDGSDGVTVFRYDPATSAFKDAIQFITGYGWFSATDPNPVLAPGEGFFIQNTLATALTVTFVGEVPQGALANPVPGGKFSLKASQVPQTARLGAAGVANTLQFPSGDGDTVYTFDPVTQAYKNAYGYIGGYGWFSADADTNVDGPEIAVGTGFWIQKAGADASWTRTFTVN